MSTNKNKYRIYNIRGDIMLDIFPSCLVDLLIISVTLSFVLMSLIQKIKKLSFINKEWQVWIINLFLSFTIAIPFGMKFYDASLIDGIWIGLFTFIGAPTLYETLKNQTILTYKPASLNSTVTIPTKNEILTK